MRLVGAPPSAIGKFGGDTDNWMWPRHTGDFALFRIYADENNEPADYSPGNVPFKPKKFFPISLEGIQPGDFTMVFGNPGSTMQYIPSHEVEIIKNTLDFLPVFFKDFDQSIDEQLFETLLPLLASDLDPVFLPGYFSEIFNKHGQDKLVQKVYQKSVLADEQKLKELLEEGNERKLLRLRKDPLVELYNRLNFHYETAVKPVVDTVNSQINRHMKTYMAGIMEMKEGD